MLMRILDMSWAMKVSYNQPKQISNRVRRSVLIMPSHEEDGLFQCPYRGDERAWCGDR